MRSRPVFKFFFACDGIVDVLISLEVYESCDFVAGGEAARCLSAVLVNSFAQIVGDPDVENVRAVGEDVDPELIFVSWHWVDPATFVLLLKKRRFPSGMTNKSAAT